MNTSDSRCTRITQHLNTHLRTTQANSDTSHCSLLAQMRDPPLRTDLTPLVDPWPSDYDLDTARHLLTDHLLRRIPRS